MYQNMKDRHFPLMCTILHTYITCQQLFLKNLKKTQIVRNDSKKIIVSTCQGISVPPSKQERAVGSPLLLRAVKL